MSKLYALNGELVRLNRLDEDEVVFGSPDAFDDVLEFDHETNQNVIDGLNGQLPNVLWQDHTLSGGILRRNGIPVTINPSGTAYLDKQVAQAFWDDLANGIDWLDARQAEWQNQSDAWDGLTNTQKQTQLLDNFGTVLGHLATLTYINYRVLRFIRWLIKAVLKPIWA